MNQTPQTTPTAYTMAGIIGALADLTLGGLTFQVRIQDVRTVFGRTDVQVQPVAGTPTMAWVARSSVSNLRAAQ